MGAVESESRFIQHMRGKSVRVRKLSQLHQRGRSLNLPLCDSKVILRQRFVDVIVRREGVVIRDLVVDLDGPCILRQRIGYTAQELAQARIGRRYGAVGKRQHGEDRLKRRRRRGTECGRRNKRVLNNSQPLAQAFIVRKKEKPILADGPTGRAAKLIQPERWLRACIKVVARIQLLVAEIFECASVKLV